MPIGFFGAGSPFASSGTTNAVNLSPPASVPSGALLLAAIALNSQTAILTPPSGEGWASVFPDDGAGVEQYGPASGLSQRLYWKISDGSEPSPHAFTLSTVQQVSGGILAYTGVDTSTPFDVAWQGLLGDNDLFIEFPAITPVTAGAYILRFGSANLGTTTPTDITGPTGFSARMLALHRRPTYVSEKVWSSGAEAAADATITSAVSGLSQGVSLVLRPGAGGSDTTPPSTVTGLARTFTSSQITLTWNAATDNVAVSGYNVYRATSSGGTYTKINASPVGALTYIDSPNPAGTYYYVVRAVDSSNNESTANSNEVNATTTVVAGNATCKWRRVGAPTDSGFVAAANFPNATSVRLVVSTSPTLTSPTYFPASPQAVDAQKYAKVTATGLNANTQYYYGWETDGYMAPFPSGQTNHGRCKTFPAAGVATTFRVAAASCQTSSSDSSVFNQVVSDEPLIILHMGDKHYDDLNTTDQNLYRTSFETQINRVNQQAMEATTPDIYVYNDHDFCGNNSSRDWVGNGSVANVGRTAVQAVYRQIIPHYPLNATTGAIWASFAIGRVQFFLMDTRSESSYKGDTDNSSKTKLGAEQKTAFKAWLLANKNAPKVIMTGEAFHNTTTDTGDGWNNYTTERTELVNYISANGITNGVWLAGDQHAVCYADAANGTPAGWPVIGASPLDQDPSHKGGPWAKRYPDPITDPTTKIQQYALLEFSDDGGSNVTMTIKFKNGAGTALLTPDTVVSFDLANTQTLGPTATRNVSAAFTPNTDPAAYQALDEDPEASTLADPLVVADPTGAAGTNITFEGSTDNTGNPTTSTSVTIPNTVNDNDIILVSVVNGDGTAQPTISDNSGVGGWTGNVNGGTVLHQVGTATAGTVFWKRITNAAVERGKIVSLGGITGSTCANLSVRRGCVTSGSPIDGTPVGEGNASGNNTQAGITTLTNGAAVHVVVFYSDNTAVTTNMVATSPATITKGGEITSSGGNDSGLAHFREIKDTAGATGAFTWAPGTNQVSTSIAFALKPIAGIAGSTVNTKAEVLMGNPTLALATGPTSGELKVAVNKKGTPDAGAGNPTFRAELHENGSATNLGTIIPETAITTAGSVTLLTNTFNQNLITNKDNVEFWLFGTGVAGGAVEFDAVEWNASVVDGAQNISRTITDALGVTDARSLARALPRSVTDALGITDSSSMLKSKAFIVTDALGITDSANRTRGLGRAVTDSVGITDSRTVVRAITRSVSDTLGVTDSRTTVKTIARAVSDAIGIIDAANRVVGRSRSVTDTLGISDSTSMTKGKAFSVTDTIGMTDSLAVARTYVKNITDSLGITDARVINKALGRAVVDSLGITDSNTRLKTIARSVNDTLGISDPMLRSIGRTRILTDNMGMVDVATSALTLVIAKNVTDTLGITDNRTLVKSVQRSITDALGITDSRTIVRAVSRSLTDSIGVTDNRVVMKAVTRIVTDTLGMTDPRVKSQTYIKSLTDSLGITDSATRQMLLVVARTITDSIGVTDSRTLIKNVVKNVNDTLGIVDSRTVAKALAKGINDAIGISDTFSKTMTRNRVITDTLGVTDVTLPLKSSFIQRTINDVLGITDVTQKSSASIIARTITDNLGMVDSRARGLHIVRTDTLGMSDVALRTAQMAKTLTDNLGLFDTQDYTKNMVKTINDVITVTDGAGRALVKLVDVTDVIGLADGVEWRIIGFTVSPFMTAELIAIPTSQFALLGVPSATGVLEP